MSKNENNNNDKILTNAQYRKSLSIAFFNATNSAVKLLTSYPEPTYEKMLSKVIEYRDFFLEEHKNYYAEVIAKVGINYRAEESIAKLQKTKNLEELNTAWRMLSEDERRDGEIIKEAQKLKKQYEKA